MTPIYSKKEFNAAQKMDELPLKCESCSKTFFILKKEIERVLRGNRTYMFKYCSLTCVGKNKTKGCYAFTKCANCDIEIKRRVREISEHKNLFCSQSCSGTYNNTHKSHGTRRSKLEIWLEEQLGVIYQNLKFDFNKKDTINSELDIYIPSLKLAFELNGIFHYEPIYGYKKLGQIQNNDDRKFQACLEKNIEFVIIDVSQLNYFKPIKCQKYLNIITEIINKKIESATHGV